MSKCNEEMQHLGVVPSPAGRTRCHGHGLFQKEDGLLPMCGCGFGTGAEEDCLIAVTVKDNVKIRDKGLGEGKAVRRDQLLIEGTVLPTAT